MRYRPVLEELEKRRLLSCPGACSESTASLQVGDANGDGTFNELDIVRVMQGGKFGTGETADWSEGDWNGDGFFDRRDLVAALQTASYKTFPKLTTVGDEQTFGKNIQRTMRLLATSTPEHRNTVRILFYGQSIVGQNWSTIVADDLRHRFPYANLVIENRAIGGFASHLLVETAETDLYPFYPDLLIFHVYGNHQRYEEIIRNVRQRTTAEILLLSDHVTSDQQLSEETNPEKLSIEGDRDAWINYAFLPSIVTHYQTGLVDVRNLWKQYLIDHDLSASELLRDTVHLNSHGNYLMAELVKAHLHFNRGAEPQADGWVTTYEVGPDASWNGDRLALEFSGNRVDVMLAGETPVRADVFIDGKKPSEFSELYGVTRTTNYPGTEWPTLLKVGHEGPLPLEEWTLTLTDINGEHRWFRFEIRGSETGFDGNGWTYARTVSNSGRVKTEARDWNLGYSFKTSGLPIDDGFQVRWQVVPHFQDQLLAAPGDLKRAEIVTLASGLPNTDHQLDIRGPWTDAIKAIQVYSPAW